MPNKSSSPIHAFSDWPGKATSAELINSGAMKDAAAHFGRRDNRDGKVVAGLPPRREAEAAEFQAT